MDKGLNILDQGWNLHTDINLLWNKSTLCSDQRQLSQKNGNYTLHSATRLQANSSVLPDPALRLESPLSFCFLVNETEE